MKLREIGFADEAACIADVTQLAKGCRAGGKWSLPQACWHLTFPIEKSLADPGIAQPTPEQRKMQGFIDQVIASGWPAGAPAPEAMIPPRDPGPNTAETLIASLRRLQATTLPRVNAFVFGPLDTAKFRRFALIHAAHHLSFFEPV